MQEQNRVVVPTQLFDVYRSCNQTGEKMFRDTLNEQQLQVLTNFTKVFGWKVFKHLALNNITTPILYCEKCGRQLSQNAVIRGDRLCRYCQDINPSNRVPQPSNFQCVQREIQIPQPIIQLIKQYTSASLIAQLAKTQYVNWFIINNVTVKTTCWAVNQGLTVIKPIYCPVCGKQLTENQYTAGTRYCSVRCSRIAEKVPEPDRNNVFDKTVTIPLIFFDFYKQSLNESIQKTHAIVFQKLLRHNHYENWLVDNNVTLLLLTQTIKDGKKTIDPVHCAHCGKLLTIGALENRSRHCSRQCVGDDPNVAEKKRQTTLRRYNANHYTQTAQYHRDVKSKKYDSFVQQLHENRITLLQTRDQFIDETTYHFKCDVCGKQWTQDTHYLQNIHCPDCVSKPYSIKELELHDLIKSIYSGEIVTNDRSILNGKELDVYLPELKIAFEFNGNYYHSTVFDRIDLRYHQRKTIECEKRGIRLIHVFEYEWDNKRKQVEDLIRNVLCPKRRLYARRCTITSITSEQYKNFLLANHFDGAVGSSIRLALWHHDLIVAVIGFGKARFSDTDQLELHRYCTRVGYQVIGGLSKLIKHSGVQSFFSYVDYSHFDGQGYERIGCKKVGLTKPGYVYAKGPMVLSRFETQKHKLIDLIDDYDPNLSEVRNMAKHNYYQVFDCGNLKFEWNRNEQ